MNCKNPVSGKRMMFPGAAVILLAILLLFACNKTSDQLPAKTENENIEAAVKAIMGNMVFGDLSTRSTDEGLLLHIGDIDIIVERRPGTDLSGLPDISSAVAFTSQHGLILKDVQTQRLYFLVNNDKESIRLFNTVAAELTPPERNDLIFGTTIVRYSKG